MRITQPVRQPVQPFRGSIPILRRTPDLRIAVYSIPRFGQNVLNCLYLHPHIHPRRLKTVRSRRDTAKLNSNSEMTVSLQGQICRLACPALGLEKFVICAVSPHQAYSFSFLFFPGQGIALVLDYYYYICPIRLDSSRGCKSVGFQIYQGVGSNQ